jgi:hypothetical protein
VFTHSTVLGLFPYLWDLSVTEQDASFLQLVEVTTISSNCNTIILDRPIVYLGLFGTGLT